MLNKIYRVKKTFYDIADIDLTFRNDMKITANLWIDVSIPIIS